MKVNVMMFLIVLQHCFYCSVPFRGLDFLSQSYRFFVGLKFVGTSACHTLADFLSWLTAFRVRTESSQSRWRLHSHVVEKTLAHVTLIASPHCINNVDFGNYISAIYPLELQLTDTSTSSTEVCYLDTHIKTGGTNTPFRISIYDKTWFYIPDCQLSSYGQQHSRQSSLRCLYISTGEIC